MSRNIEIKAQLSDVQFAEACRVSADLTGDTHTVLKQRDTYFNAPLGRLKLREFGDDTAELIGYQREDQTDPTASNYYRTQVNGRENIENLIDGMKLTLGLRGVVEKTRLLFIHNITRIHLDEVVSLGHFLELEVVLMDGQSDEEGIKIANHLMKRLNVRQDQLITSSYIDLMDATIA